MLNDLQPRLQLDHATIRLNKIGQQNYDLAGNGVLLVPEMFAGPHLLFDPGNLGLPVIGYAAAALAWSGRTTAPVFARSVGVPARHECVSAAARPRHRPRPLMAPAARFEGMPAAGSGWSATSARGS